MFNHLKKLSILVVATSSLVFIAPQALAGDTVIQQTQTHSVFKGFLLSFWGKFKSYNPHKKQIAKSGFVYTAGVRGAEATGTLLQPVWKDDLSKDPRFQQELKMYGEALTHLDNGSLKQANASLGLFLTEFPKSSLKPNALFAQGISYAGVGDNANASKVLRQFSDEYSSHPLATDAANLIRQLN